MGCLCSKVSAVEDSREGLTNKLPSSAKGSSELKVQLTYASKDGGNMEKEKSRGNHIEVSSVENKDHSSTKLYHDHQCSDEKEGEKPDVTAHKLNNPSIGSVPKALEAEHVAAGWPAWLSAVAGEAIHGWVPRSANAFEKLDKIGQGTYSSVYKAHDLAYQKVVALKKVRFDNLDPESVKFMAREILVLRRLQHPNIIKLEGLITSQMSRSLYLVFEYMEHDLTGLASRPGVKFSQPQVKCYMKQLLSGLDYCHRHGVLHRDIKGSNLLIDNNGILKIADFGLATFSNPDHSVPLTSRVVTLWYRPPELLLGASHYGVAVDLWSAGCILGEIYAGKPILPGKTEVEQLHKIFKLCGSPSEDYWGRLRLPRASVFKPPHHYRRCIADTFKELPAVAVRLIETLISIDPASRGTATAALESEFFTTEPLACDPSTLPRYPPSKEIDAKLQGEVCRRQGPSGVRQLKFGLGTLPEKEASGVPAAKINKEKTTSIQRIQAHSSSTSHSQLHNGHKNKSLSGLLVVPSKESDHVKEITLDHPEHPCERPSFSGPLVQGGGWTKAGKEVDAQSMSADTVKLSNFSSLVATKMQSCQDKQEKRGSAQHEKTIQHGRCIDSMDGSQSRWWQDQRHQSQRVGYFYHHDDERLSTKDASGEVLGSRGDRIYVSGPLLFPSNNVDQILKDHDQRIRQFSRRARIDKTRGQKV